MRQTVPERSSDFNNRFQYAIRCLLDRGDIVPNDRKRGWTHFARLVLGDKRYGHLAAQYLQGKRDFPLKHVQAFCRHYGVNYDFMMHGWGKVFDPPRSATDYRRSNEAETLDESAAGKQQGNILFCKMEALAGGAVGSQLKEQVEHFSVPGLSGEWVAFPVKGNSMQPTVPEGDTVFCRPVSPGERIVENDIYAIVLADAVLVKRIQTIKNKSGQVVKFKLLSDNYLEHDPFAVSAQEVLRLYKAEHRLTHF